VNASVSSSLQYIALFLMQCSNAEMLSCDHYIFSGIIYACGMHESALINKYYCEINCGNYNN
jgi:hypothetical protein